MDFRQVGTLGTPIIIAAKNQLPELNGSYKGIFFKTTYDPSSEEDYPKGTILTVVENSDGTFSWSRSTVLEKLTNGIADGSQLLKDIEAFDGRGNKIVGTLESGSGTGDIKNPYKARTYSEMNGYRTKKYANAYVEYTGQRQFTRNQIQDSSMYDKLYFDFPRQIGWVEIFDWDNPDSNWTSDGLLYKCIVLFNVTPTKISDNTTEEAVPFSVYQMTATRDSSDVQAGTVMYGIGFPSSFSWVSWGGTPDKEYSRTGYKLKITNVKREYYYLIGDIISTTGEWSQIIDGMQFGYKHGTYKIDTNSKTVDNFQKLDLVLEDGGGGTANKTITNDYSYNLDSYYDYILKYSYEGKSSSVICKVGNFSSEGHIIEGAKQLYNTTSDGEPAGIFFSLDTNCPLPYGWNSGLVVDNLDLSTGQSASNKSVVNVGSGLYTLVGKTVTIEDISTAADMIYYTTLPSLSTPAAATDIVKGKQAIDAEGNRISGTLEPVDNPYTAKNTTELLNYCNGKYENAIVKVEDLTKTVETEIAVGDAISKLYFNTSITPNFSNLNWSNPDYERDGILVINILQSEEHFNNGEEDISWDGITVRRYDCSNQDSANPYRYSLNFASWFTLWTDNEFLHANNPDFYPVPGWNYTGLKTLGWLGIKNNVFSINSLMGQAIHVKAMKSQDLWKSFVSSAQDAWESKYYKIGEPDKNVLTSPVSLTCRSGNSVDLAYTLKLDKNSQWVINLTLGNTTVNKVVKQTSPVLNGTSIGGSQTLVELDWTSGNTNGINVDFGNNETINLFIGDCMDFNDTNHQGQYNSSASTFVINNASSMASGYELTINSITPISSYDEYHYLAANDRIVATASDIKKGKGAFNANGEFVVGNYEGVVLPTLTNEGTAADLATGKQLINGSGEIITGTANLTNKLAQVIDKTVTEITAEDLAGATNIRDYAFNGCSELASITIPDSVTKIGWYAFQNCYNLTNITINNNITNIGLSAFFSCINLRSVIIGSGITIIGNTAFSNCSKLTNITLLPTTPPGIGSGVFSNISASATFTVPKGTLNAYQTADGWSTYADKMVEATE